MTNTTARQARKARKARQRAGLESYAKPQKVATPVILRSFVQADVYRKQGDAMPSDSIARPKLFGFTQRSARRAAAFINSGGIRRGSSLSGRAANA